MCGDLFNLMKQPTTIDGYIQKVKQVAALLDYVAPANSTVIQEHFA